MSGLPLQARLVEAQRLTCGRVWAKLKFIAAPASVIGVPVHLLLDADDLSAIAKARFFPVPANLSLADALELRLPAAAPEGPAAENEPGRKP